MILDKYNLVHIITSVDNACAEMYDGCLTSMCCEYTETSLDIMKIIASTFKMQIIVENKSISLKTDRTIRTYDTRINISHSSGIVIINISGSRRITKSHLMTYNIAHNAGRCIDHITGAWTEIMYEEMMQGYEVLSEKLGIYKTESKFIINPDINLLTQVMSRRQYRLDIEYLWS